MDRLQTFEEFIASQSIKIPVLSFSIMDPDPQVLADYVGGSFDAEVAGTSPATWGFDGSEVVVNKAIKVETAQGMVLDVPNADIEAVINAEFSNKGIFLVDFTVTPMAVTSGKAIYAYEPLP